MTNTKERSLSEIQAENDLLFTKIISQFNDIDKKISSINKSLNEGKKWLGLMNILKK